MGQPSGGGNDTANPLVTGSFAATGQSGAAVFYGDFNVSFWGAFTATIQLQRSFDGGSTWVPCSQDATGTIANYTIPCSMIASEPEHLVFYRVACVAYTAGTVNYRLSQSSDAAFIGGTSR